MSIPMYSSDGGGFHLIGEEFPIIRFLSVVEGVHGVGGEVDTHAGGVHVVGVHVGV